MFGRFAKILVVDDSAVARKIIRRLLNTLGMENIDEAADGGAALVLLERHTYRLVLSDWNMAPVDGLQLLQTMRADLRLRTVPFIMVTAQSQRKFTDIPRDGGITHYLAKPFTAEMLRERIVRVAKMEIA